jgi:hypothetical protein
MHHNFVVSSSNVSNDMHMGTYIHFHITSTRVVTLIDAPLTDWFVSVCHFGCRGGPSRKSVPTHETNCQQTTRPISLRCGSNEPQSLFLIWWQFATNNTASERERKKINRFVVFPALSANAAAQLTTLLEKSTRNQTRANATIVHRVHFDQSKTQKPH